MQTPQSLPLSLAIRLSANVNTVLCKSLHIVILFFIFTFQSSLMPFPEVPQPVNILQRRSIKKMPTIDCLRPILCAGYRGSGSPQSMFSCSTAAFGPRVANGVFTIATRVHRVLTLCGPKNSTGESWNTYHHRRDDSAAHSRWGR